MSEKFMKAILIGTGAAPTLEEIVPDKWITYPISGMRNDPKGRCKLFLDGESGIYIKWDENGRINWHTWQARKPSTQEQLTAFQINVEKAKREVAKIVAEQRAKCRQQSAVLWEKGRAVDANHPYLVAKNIRPYCVRQLNERLMVPVKDVGGTLRGLQFIAPNGSKQFKAGTLVTGCYHIIGTPNGKLLITEAWETACTLHQATGHAVAVAFNCNNMKPVAEALRAAFPEEQIVVCADDDGNQGIAKAGEAARAVNGFLAETAFLEDKEVKDADLNALAHLVGLGVVKACIEGAAMPIPCQVPGPETKAASSQNRVIDAADFIVLELPFRSVLFVHHGGKDGAQRGMSHREDLLLDTVITLRRPGGNTAAQKGCFEVYFEKTRGIYGNETKPFEAQLMAKADGRQGRTTRTMGNSTAEKVAALLSYGLKQKEIAAQLKLTKGTVSKAKAKAVRLGLLNVDS
jgi:putative DNA primase/helicase